MLAYYATHSPFTHPGPWGRVLGDLPTDIPELCQSIQGLIVHYRASGIQFAPDRLAEIDTRTIQKMLGTIQTQDTRRLSQAREPQKRFVGCCRDYTLLFVAAMREHGIPARSRVGFAPYLNPNFNHDHVVGEYWNGQRWVMVDAEIPPEQFDFDVQDIPKGVFLSAAVVWQAFGQNRLDPDRFGVAPGLPYGGAWFIRNYVVKELAHLCKHELLLWDEWGLMSDQLNGDLALIDYVAGRLLQGDTAFEQWHELMQNPLLKVPPEVMCYSPTGNIQSVKLETATAA